jgi:peptidoglycan-N-acetylglucosamine deacetylase
MSQSPTVSISTPPMISVVIPAYNEAKFIERALESLRQQDYPNFEIIVVDNNSQDRTAEITKRYGVTVIYEARRGVAYARNAGFRAAHGEVIATTDADTILPPHWLSHIARKFQNNPLLVAYGGLYSLNSGSLQARLFFPRAAYVLWRIDKYINRGWSLTGANMAVRRHAFRTVGGFNTDLHVGEDADLSQRLKRLGSVVFDKTLLVSTSGRRYRNGLWRATFEYLPNALARGIFKKHAFNRLPPIR